MAPLGTKVYVHIKPNCLASWGFHAKGAWYVGPAPKHYHCFMVIMDDTAAKHISNIVKLQHHAVNVLQITTASQVTQVTKYLTVAIQAIPDNAPADCIQEFERLRPIPTAAIQPIPDNEPAVCIQTVERLKTCPT